jgi:hypothetical protein
MNLSLKAWTGNELRVRTAWKSGSYERQLVDFLKFRSIFLRRTHSLTRAPFHRTAFTGIPAFHHHWPTLISTSFYRGMDHTTKNMNFNNVYNLHVTQFSDMVYLPRR